MAFRMGGGILNSVKFNEEYRGEKIPAGQRGIVFSLRYKAADRTLREEEVNEVHEKILRAFVAELGAIQRWILISIPRIIFLEILACVIIHLVLHLGLRPAVRVRESILKPTL